MKKADYAAMREDELTALFKEKIATDPNWVARALLAVYQQQTTDEQTLDQTVEHNGIGFSGTDASFCSSVAKQALSGKALSPKQIAALHKIMPKYARQLARLVKGDIPEQFPERKLEPGEFRLDQFNLADNILSTTIQKLGFDALSLPDRMVVWGQGWNCPFTFKEFLSDDQGCTHYAVYSGLASNDQEYRLLVYLASAMQAPAVPMPLDAPALPAVEMVVPLKRSRKRRKEEA